MKIQRQNVEGMKHKYEKSLFVGGKFQGEVSSLIHSSIKTDMNKTYVDITCYGVQIVCLLIQASIFLFWNEPPPPHSKPNGVRKFSPPHSRTHSRIPKQVRF